MRLFRLGASAAQRRFSNPNSKYGERPAFGLHQDLGYYSTVGSRALREDVAAYFTTNISRSSMLWHDVEATEGVEDWSRYDAIVGELEARSIVPIFTPVGSPTWASGTADISSDKYWFVPTNQTAFDLWADKWAAFVAKAAARYGPRIPYWEIWNEPNQPYFWRGVTPNPEWYASLFNKTKDAILAVHPTAKICTGGIVGTTAGPTWTPTFVGGWDGNGGGIEFLTRALAAGAAPGTVGIHPYTDGSPLTYYTFDNSFSDINKVRDLLWTNGLYDVDLWVTEWGWSNASHTSATIGPWITEAIKLINTNFPFVKMVVYFKDVDTPEYVWGLATDAGVAKEPQSAAWETAITTETAAIPRPIIQIAPRADGSSPITSTLPAAAKAGNILISTLGTDKGSGTITIPSGFTPLGAAYAGSSVGGQLAFKVATGGETTATWSFSAATVGRTILAELDLDNLNTAAITSGVFPNPANENTTAVTADLGTFASPGWLIGAMAIDTVPGGSVNFSPWPLGWSTVLTDGRSNNGVSVAVKKIAANESTSVTSSWWTGDQTFVSLSFIPTSG